MGLIFLHHAYSRYLAVKDSVEADLPTRGGRTRPLAKEDFSQKSAIFLQPKAQFDTLVALPDSADRAKAIIKAMESIEADYESLRGVLPKSEYQELDNAVLGQLLRTLNPEELKSNFFYTRTVPCEFWFLNRAKPEAHRDKVLMIDARNTYRKVTRKIYDFSPRSGAKPAGHRLALPGRDRSLSRPGGELLPAHAGQGLGLFHDERRRR